MPDSARWAKSDIPSRKFLHQVNRREFFDDRELRTSEQLAYRQFLAFDSRSEKTIMPDFRKTRRQNMKQKPSNKLVSIQSHDLLFGTVFVIPPLE